MTRLQVKLLANSCCVSNSPRSSIVGGGEWMLVSLSYHTHLCQMSWYDHLESNVFAMCLLKGANCWFQNPVQVLAAEFYTVASACFRAWCCKLKHAIEYLCKLLVYREKKGFKWVITAVGTAFVLSRSPGYLLNGISSAGNPNGSANFPHIKIRKM